VSEITTITLPTLPDQPSAGEEIHEFRRENLMEYLNRLYELQEVKTHHSYKEFLGI
jgi:hypothetical protein